MDHLVHFSPNTITFEFTPGRQTTTRLHLRNVSEHRIAYKVKTTHIKRYSVCPNAAIIQPGAEIDVQLTQQSLKVIPKDINMCRDRFLLQVARLDLIPSGNAGGEHHGYDSVMDLWTAVPEGVIHKAKFSVILRIADPSGKQDLQLETRNVPDGHAAPIPSPSLLVGHEKTDVPSSVPDTYAKGALLRTTPEAVPETNTQLGNVLRLHEQQEREKRDYAEAALLTTTSETVSENNTPLGSSLDLPKEQEEEKLESAEDTLLTAAPQAVSEANAPLGSIPSLQEEQERQKIEPSPTNNMPNPSSVPVGNSREFMTTPQESISRTPNVMSTKSNHSVDYNSVEYARERALNIRTAPKIPVPDLDEPMRQRVAVERAGELVRTINARNKDIETVNRELSEARHRLSDARMATRPAYDIKYEISESARIPYAQIAIMAIISGALLQLLV